LDQSRNECNYKRATFRKFSVYRDKRGELIQYIRDQKSILEIKKETKESIVPKKETKDSIVPIL
jgi:hypothetical protein